MRIQAAPASGGTQRHRFLNRRSVIAATQASRPCKREQPQRIAPPGDARSALLAIPWAPTTEPLVQSLVFCAALWTPSGGTKWSCGLSIFSLNGHWREALGFRTHFYFRHGCCGGHFNHVTPRRSERNQSISFGNSIGDSSVLNSLGLDGDRADALGSESEVSQFAVGRGDGGTKLRLATSDSRLIKNGGKVEFLTTSWRIKN